MRLTRQTNYAIRILMYCAANKGNLSRITDIAKSYAISETFIFKILPPLVKNGFLLTIRGRNGGVELARDASEINLAQIVQVTEESFALSECLEDVDTECPLIDYCGLSQAFKNALSAFLKSLEGVTIADLTDKRYNVKNKLKISLDNSE